jgi:tetratricopeptide (TPR) repeat protein
MRRGPILSLAGACGAAAFLWIILSQPRPQERRPTGAGPPRTLAHDPEGAERAIVNRPNGFEEWFIVATLRSAHGPAPDAWAEAARSATTYAESASPESPRAIFYLARAKEQLGDIEGARNTFARAASLYESRVQGDGFLARRYPAWMALAWCYGKLGRPDDAKDAWQHALTLITQTHPTELTPQMAYDGACCEAQLGAADQAVWFLQQAAKKGFGDFIWAQRDEYLAPLEANEGFMTWLLKGAG